MLCAHAMRAITNHAPIGDSSPMKNSNVHVKTIQLNQEDTFFMIVWGLMGTGTQEEIHSAISSCSW